MGLLINNELIWLSVPKCASHSIEKSLLNSSLNIIQLKKDGLNPDKHSHHPISVLFEEFGIHKTICIKRDWCERWISALKYLFDTIEDSSKYNEIIKWKDVDNEFIYNIFDTDCINLLHNANSTNDNYKQVFLKFIKEKELHPLEFKENGETKVHIVPTVCVLLSQNFWKENISCNYEFDIKEIDKFVDFIYEQYGEKLIVKKLNESPKTKNKIIVDDKLKNWIWDNFEKRFEKGKKLV
jgi:hypothetical protein